MILTYSNIYWWFCFLPIFVFWKIRFLCQRKKKPVL